jgi:hypothetical protein
LKITCTRDFFKFEKAVKGGDLLILPVGGLVVGQGSRSGSYCWWLDPVIAATGKPHKVKSGPQDAIRRMLNKDLFLAKVRIGDVGNTYGQSHIKIPSHGPE